MNMLLWLFTGLFFGLIVGGFLVATFPGTLMYAVSTAAIGAIACVHAILKDLENP